MLSAVETKGPRRRIQTASADPSPPTQGADGFPVRKWEVDGEVREFSLRPYPEDERPVYWFYRPNMSMWWRSQDINEYGLQPVIQKEAWLFGKFAPRNDWELHMTREWLRNEKVDPDKCVGENHPEGPGHGWRCECAFLCSNWYVFQQHQRSLSHTKLRSE